MWIISQLGEPVNLDKACAVLAGQMAASDLWEVVAHYSWFVQNLDKNEHGEYCVAIIQDCTEARARAVLKDICGLLHAVDILERQNCPF